MLVSAEWGVWLEKIAKDVLPSVPARLSYIVFCGYVAVGPPQPR